MGTILKQRLAKIKIQVQAERGLGLVESLVAVAILGTAVVAFVIALSTGSIAVREGNQEAQAQRMARTQLEEIKAAPYAGNYTPIAEPDYDISVTAGSIPDTDADIQKITVTISRDGSDILIVEDFKVNR